MIPNQRINDQIKKIQDQASSFGLSARQSEVFRLAQMGATKAQQQQADATLKQIEAMERGRAGFLCRVEMAISSTSRAMARKSREVVFMITSLCWKAGRIRRLWVPTSRWPVSQINIVPAT